MNISNKNHCISAWDTALEIAFETKSFSSIPIKVSYNYWVSQDNVNQSDLPSEAFFSADKIIFIAKNTWMALSGKEEKEALVSQVLHPLVAKDIEGIKVRKLQEKNEISFLKNWVSSSSKQELITSLESYLNGVFGILDRRPGFTIIYKQGTLYNTLDVDISPDGSIIIPGEYPSLAHMVVSSEYNHLKYPIIAGNTQDNKKSIEFMNIVWNILLDKSKINPYEQMLASDLRILVTAYSPIPLLLPDEREKLLAKLGIENFDLKFLLEMIQSFPEIIRESLLYEYMHSFVKSLGHEWGLACEVKLGKTLFSTCSSKSDISHSKLAQSVKKYFNPSLQSQSRNQKRMKKSPKHSSAINFFSKLVFRDVSQEPRKDPELEKLDPELRKKVIEDITTSLDKSIILSTDEDKTNHQAVQIIRDYFSCKPITIGTGWHRHGIEITLYDHYIAFTNRGPRLYDPKDPYKEIRTEIFRIPNEFRITPTLMRRIMLSPESISAEKQTDRMEWLESGIHNELEIDVSKPLFVINKSSQKIGNCTWANAKGGFLSELVLILLKQNLNKGINSETALLNAISAGSNIFKEWEYHHRDRLLDEFLELSNYLDDPNMPLDKKNYYKLLVALAAKIYLKKRNSKKLLPPLAANLKEEFYAKVMHKLMNLNFSLDECLGKSLFFDLEKDNQNKKNPSGIRLTILSNSYDLIPFEDHYLYNSEHIHTIKDLLRVFPDF